jgi:prolyl-tRNA synthetase
MRTSQYLLSTEKEAPSDAELTSHQLMVRAGFIRQLGSGLYTWMPLGLRVLNKVAEVIREELDKIGAQQMLMPSIQPAELWKESGRWDQYGPLMLRIQDRNDRQYCYGPTHEEVITDVMRKGLNSYKQLPQTFYQIQTKFRDELRPRFGVMRAREFLMKDAYSFHLTEACLDSTYQTLKKAYSDIFTRLGLDFRVVLADSGEIGGEQSEEFHVLANSGEDILAVSSEGNYAANLEKATAKAHDAEPLPPSLALKEVHTPGIVSIAEQSTCVNLPTSRLVKTLIVEGIEEGTYVALLLRGDDELNPLKAEKHAAVKSPLTLADEPALATVTHCAPGFCGPIGLTIPVIADHKVLAMSDFSCGANKDDYHFVGVNWGRDCPVPESMDLRNVCEGDPAPIGNGTLQFTRGIEVGHIFQLGTKYSTSMNATVLDENGKSKPIHMGCYGIGVSRVVAAAIEQHHDEKGLCLPEVMSPFTVAIVQINPKKDEKVSAACNELYTRLQQSGVSVLLDDRKERPGVMFAEMDLIGIPHRLVISARGLGEGTLEYKHRLSDDAEHVKVDEIEPFLTSKGIL